MDRIRKSAARRDEGFTLIELLIVIVVLGILAGIAIFGVSQFRTDAKDACTKANSRINQTISAISSTGAASAYASSTGAC